jgi:hypothetical protein
MDPTTTNALIAAASALGGSLITALATIYVNRPPKATIGQSLEGKRELRILRALIGEDGGRALNIYRKSDHYRPAVESLDENGYIRRQKDQYFLTEKGMREVRAHLLPLIQSKRGAR